MKDLFLYSSDKVIFCLVVSILVFFFLRCIYMLIYKIDRVCDFQLGLNFAAYDYYHENIYLKAIEALDNDKYDEEYWNAKEKDYEYFSKRIQYFLKEDYTDYMINKVPWYKIKYSKILKKDDMAKLKPYLEKNKIYAKLI